LTKTNKVNLWIVGEHISGRGQDIVWDFIGVFDDEELAKQQCKKTDHFIAPAVLNQALPPDRLSWPGCYYPLLEEKPSGD
jgi:hypothetical protein